MNTTHPRPNKSNQLICYPAMYRSQLPPDFFVLVNWLSISNHPRTLGPVQGFYGTEAESIYVFEQLNIHYQLFLAGYSEASNRIKPFLRRRSGHPSADEDLHRHESHSSRSGRRAADDGRHGESRDPPGDSNDTGSGQGPWCGGGGGMGWLLSDLVQGRCFLIIHHLG